MIENNIYPSDPWQIERIGCFTASEIDNLFTDPKTKADKDSGELSDTAHKYVLSKISELMTGTIRSLGSMPALDWGNKYEPEAIEALKSFYPGIIYYGNDTRRFFKYSSFSGGSPDAVDGNIVFEIKSPENPANHIKNLLITTQEQLKSEYRGYYHQLQFNMACVAKSLLIEFKDIRGQFVSYCPLMQDESKKLYGINVEPDLEFKKQLDERIERAERKLKEIIKQLL